MTRGGSHAQKALKGSAFNVYGRSSEKLQNIQIQYIYITSWRVIYGFFLVQSGNNYLKAYHRILVFIRCKEYIATITSARIVRCKPLEHVFLAPKRHMGIATAFMNL